MAKQNRRNGELRTYWLPWPPSVNSMFAHYNGRRILTKPTRQWKARALEEIGLQAPTLAPVPCEITILLYPPSKRTLDADNRNKATVDLLKEAHIIEDDNVKIAPKITAEFVEYDTRKEGFVLVEVAPYEPTEKRICTTGGGNIRDAFLGVGSDQ